jgi:hypothetical protein
MTQALGHTMSHRDSIFGTRRVTLGPAGQQHN